MGRRPGCGRGVLDANARTAPPASSSAVSVANDTDSPEYAEMRSPVRTTTSALDTSSTFSTSTRPDPASIDIMPPDDMDTAPLLSIDADPVDTATSAPLNSSIVFAPIDTRSDDATTAEVDSTLTTSPVTRTVSPLLTSTELPAATLTTSELTDTDSPDANANMFAADTLTEPAPTPRPKWNTAPLHPAKLGLP